MYDYKEETLATIIDSKILIENVLENNFYTNFLKDEKIKREYVENIKERLEELIKLHKISSNLQTNGIKNKFDINTSEDIIEILRYINKIINEIEDPWFWTENEDDLEEITNNFMLIFPKNK